MTKHRFKNGAANRSSPFAQRQMQHRGRLAPVADLCGGTTAHTMRQHLNRNEKHDGPFGIRAMVWFVVFGCVLLCMLIITRHHAKPPEVEIAAEAVGDQNSSRHPWTGARRTAQQQVKPEDYEDRAGDPNEEIDLTMVEQVIQDRRTWVDGSGL